MMSNRLIGGLLLGAVLAVLGAFAVRGMYATAVPTTAAPSQNQFVCMYDNNMTLLYQQFEFLGVDGDVIEVLTPAGYTLYYKMHNGEQCGYHPRVTINPTPGFPGDPIVE